MQNPKRVRSNVSNSQNLLMLMTCIYLFLPENSFYSNCTNSAVVKNPFSCPAKRSNPPVSMYLEMTVVGYRVVENQARYAFAYLALRFPNPILPPWHFVPEATGIIMTVLSAPQVPNIFPSSEQTSWPGVEQDVELIAAALEPPDDEEEAPDEGVALLAPEPEDSPDDAPDDPAEAPELEAVGAGPAASPMPEATLAAALATLAAALCTDCIAPAPVEAPVPGGGMAWMVIDGEGAPTGAAEAPVFEPAEEGLAIGIEAAGAELAFEPDPPAAATAGELPLEAPPAPPHLGPLGGAKSPGFPAFTTDWPGFGNWTSFCFSVSQSVDGMFALNISGNEVSRLKISSEA